MNSTRLINALNTIKKTCAESDDCKVCPLHDPNDVNSCFANESPTMWELNEEYDTFVPSVFEP